MKIIKIIIFLFISLNVSLKTNSNNNNQNILNESGKLIFIRHAYAPGVGDPDNFNILDCATQRNLNDEGIEQSRNIGEFFLEKDIFIDEILSSEWCRCKETSQYAFNRYETKFFLNSFFIIKFSHNKYNQIIKLKEYIKKWDGKKNIVFVTHYVVILEILNIRASSGEIIIFNKDYEVLARVKNRLFQ